MATFEEPFELEHGGCLPRFELAFETWGALNEDRSNAVLLETGLSASSHAASTAENGSRGWWEAFVGPGKAVDTDRWFVVCSNVLGGCFGSTGPSSPNPATGLPYGLDLPILSVRDMARAQLRLLDRLGIERLAAVVGGSLGGMQAIALAAEAPERVDAMVSISAAARSYPASIAMRFAQRRAIMADPHFEGGRYYGGPGPVEGMKVARAMGTISYRSGPEWEQRFGRSRGQKTPQLGADFTVESYLEYQSEKFARSYDANSYLYISKAMDLFDLGEIHGASLAEAVGRIRARSLVMGVSSDVLFPVWQQREVADLLAARPDAASEYVELDAPQGHDTFLILEREVGGPVKAFLEG